MRNWSSGSGGSGWDLSVLHRREVNGRFCTDLLADLLAGITIESGKMVMHFQVVSDDFTF